MVQVRTEVPLVRCRLEGPQEQHADMLRYVPLAEFELWRHLMETRHARRVTVEAVSVWVAEHPALWDSGFRSDELEPVLRVRFTRPGPFETPTPVERYFPAETYPRAQEALLSHLPVGSDAWGFEATPGYFVPRSARPDLTLVA